MKVLKEEQEKATEICENIAKKVQSVQGEMKGGLSAYAELITAQVEASKNRIGIADQIVKLKKTMLDYNFKDKNGSAGNGEAEDIKQILLQINNNNSNGGTPKTPQEAFVITEDNENK